mmetsp:Transcript_1471/g.3954  ORF Transcript_1471/g.3954 Transcript_1471/m.3954 type:complete len:224 (+) Transcript_1471:2224-2895(+)
MNRGVHRFGGRGEPRDAADDGVVTNADDDPLAGTFGGCGRVERQVSRLQGILMRHLVLAGLRLGLAREGAVVHFEPVAFEDANVGWDAVATLDLHHVSAHQLHGVHLKRLAVPQHGGLTRSHLGPALHDGTGLCLLVVREAAGQGYDDDQDDTEVEVLRSLRIQRKADKREDRSSPEERGETTKEMGGKHNEPRGALGRGQLVPSFLVQPLGRLHRRHPLGFA